MIPEPEMACHLRERKVSRHGLVMTGPDTSVFFRGCTFLVRNQDWLRTELLHHQILRSTQDQEHQGLQQATEERNYGTPLASTRGIPSSRIR